MNNRKFAADRFPHRALWALWAALLSAPGSSRAESLADAWAMALQSDGTVAAARSERQAAEADYSAAARRRWPALDINGTYTQLDHAPILAITTPTGRLQAPIWRHDGYATASAGVSVPVWTSGRISGDIGAAAAGSRGAAAQEILSTSDLKLTVAESYVGVFRARCALPETP